MKILHRSCGRFPVSQSGHRKNEDSSLGWRFSFLLFLQFKEIMKVPQEREILEERRNERRTEKEEKKEQGRSELEKRDRRGSTIKGAERRKRRKV